MARPLESSTPDAVVFHGEVWTDARGYATVSLPPGADRLLPPLEYELCDLDPPSTARITAELKDGHFSIATEEPHVKVAWRLTGQRGAGQRASDLERSI